MRTLNVTVGGRHFEFFVYQGHVAVNVKFHGWAEPVGEEATCLWNKLSVNAQDRLRDQAWESIRECWWEDIKLELAGYRISRDGRQGGYLIFDQYSDGRVETLEEDAALEGCSVCRDLLHDPVVGPLDHAAHQEMLRRRTPPLPFPDAPWELSCVHCAEYYHQHVDGRCPLHLGVLYEPHAYRGDCLQELEELDSAIALVEKRVNKDTLQAWLNDELTQAILSDDYEKQTVTAGDADT